MWVEGRWRGGHGEGRALHRGAGWKRWGETPLNHRPGHGEGGIRRWAANGREQLQPVQAVRAQQQVLGEHRHPFVFRNGGLGGCDGGRG